MRSLPDPLSISFRKRITIASCALFLAASVGGVAATVLESDASSNSQTAFDANILNNDLIENGSGGLSGAPLTTGSISSYAGAGPLPNSWINLTDGLASSKDAPNTGNNDISHDTYFDPPALATNPSITYSLNIGAVPQGYDLTQIRSISGWADTTTFSNQAYSISLSYVSNPGVFTPFYTVAYSPFSSNAAVPNSSQVTLTGSSGDLAVGVAGIRFSFLNNGSGSSGQVFREIDVSTSTPVPAPPPPLPPGPVIMPLGDSITYGDGVAGGYRTKLYTSLQAADPTHQPQFVGSQTGNASTTLATANEVNHEGHDGYRIDQIVNNLFGSDGSGGNNGGYWLAGTGGRSALFPDIILLHIGTNDILQHFNGGATEADFMSGLESRLSSLVAEIVAARPNSHLFLASIIPILGRTNSNGVDENVEVQQYDAYIQNTLVPSLQSSGDNVTFVDQYSQFLNADQSVNASFLQADGIHPSQAGYDAIGTKWATAIQSAPEPASTGSLLIGLATVGGLIRRRRSAQSGAARFGTSPAEVSVVPLPPIHCARARSLR